MSGKSSQRTYREANTLHPRNLVYPWAGSVGVAMLAALARELVSDAPLYVQHTWAFIAFVSIGICMIFSLILLGSIVTGGFR